MTVLDEGRNGQFVEGKVFEKNPRSTCNIGDQEKDLVPARVKGFAEPEYVVQRANLCTLFSALKGARGKRDGIWKFYKRLGAIYVFIFGKLSNGLCYKMPYKWRIWLFDKVDNDI